MSKKKPAHAARSAKRIEFETFMEPGPWALNSLESSNAPSCFNGDVRIRRWRVVIEPIEDTPEVIAERLRALWRGTNNHHHRDPLKRAARLAGIELDEAEWGADAPERGSW